ncbi:MAG: hypothetical protein HYZ88_00735 [Candidatus Omnitrophica bacterium]|nr:hypothetical protein [Candidatus Omnitrophota bacterium]
MFSRNKLFLLAICSALSALFSGCGYSTSRLLPSSYQSIYVEPFQNEIPITEVPGERTGLYTSVPELEEKITQGVLDRFLFDGNLRVTTNPETADLRLTGKLVDFYRQAIRRQDDDTVEEYRLNLTASLTLRDRNDKLLLQEPNFVADTTYFVSGSLARSETAAVSDLVIDFSRRVVEWVIEYW